jgi:hypothetical protein
MEDTMASEFKFDPPRTYANRENARKAVEAVVSLGKAFGGFHVGRDCRYMIVEVGDRFAPVIIHCADMNVGDFALRGITVVA